MRQLCKFKLHAAHDCALRADAPYANMDPPAAVPSGSGPADELVRALAHGSLIVATYGPEDVLGDASAAFKRAFWLETVEGATTFADLILQGARNRTGPGIDCEDPHRFIAETQLRQCSHPREGFYDGHCNMGANGLQIFAALMRSSLTPARFE